MRRILFIVAVVTLLVSGVSMAEETVPVAGAAESGTGDVCDLSGWVAESATRTDAELEAVRTLTPAPTHQGGVPLSCPTTKTCVGGGNTCSTNPGNCAATGSSTAIDFGSSSCELPNGYLFRCKGSTTVHLVTTQCEQCKCCNMVPACFCPLNCGEARTLACL